MTTNDELVAAIQLQLEMADTGLLRLVAAASTFDAIIKTSISEVMAARNEVDRLALLIADEPPPPPPPPPPAPTGKLQFRPPFDPLNPPAGVKVYDVPVAGGSFTGAGNDALFRFPFQVSGKVTIKGFGKVVVWAPKMLLGTSGQQRCLVLEDNFHAHVEGGWFDPTGGKNWQADAIIANSRVANSIITIQNCYIHDVNGQAGDQTGDPEHGDAIQCWAGPSVLHVSYLTVNTRYQGLLLQPGSAVANGVWTFDHIDIQRPTATGWQLYHLNSTLTKMVKECYAYAPLETNQADILHANFSTVTIGKSPARFVDPTKVGIGYVSPGYV